MKMINEKTLHYIMSTIAAFFLVYLLYAFVEMDIAAINWGIGTRFSYVIVAGVLSVIFITQID